MGKRAFRDTDGVPPWVAAEPSRVKAARANLTEAINDQLDTIILQATALREGKTTNRLAAVSLLRDNVETLRHWELRRTTLGD